MKAYIFKLDFRIYELARPRSTAALTISCSSLRPANATSARRLIVRAPEDYRQTQTTYRNRISKFYSDNKERIKVNLAAASIQTLPTTCTAAARKAGTGFGG